MYFQELRSQKWRSVTSFHACSSVHGQLFQDVFQFPLVPLLLNQAQFHADSWLMHTVFLVRTWRGTGPRIWPGHWHFIWRIKEGTEWVSDKPFQFSNLVSVFCITFVFGVDPAIVLSNDWTLSTFPAVKGASVPCRERHSPCFVFISSHVPLSKY